MPERARRVVALAGGVGGARLVEGLAAHLAPGELTVIVNTGDDLVHWGLAISPDLDTVMYTLAGLAHRERGWGLLDESFHALGMVGRLGGEDWFQLGDRDLGVHLVRTQLLARGLPLTEVTGRLCRALGVEHAVLPAADQPRRTVIETAAGELLAFQRWLVQERGAPAVRAVHFQGVAGPTAAVVDALDAADLVIVCPSNPYVSIDPILTLESVRARVAAHPVVAVSPIVRGKAVKGPLGGMIASLTGRAPSAAAVAAHYGALLDGFVVERGDEAGIELPLLATSTVMGGREGRVALAAEVLRFAESIE